MRNNRRVAPFLATFATAAVISVSTQGNAQEPPRGMDVRPGAGVCNIGSFPQTSKAGSYNVLCNVMQDAEKCLAFIKGHFSFDGQNVTVHPVNEQDIRKAEYCLDVLKRDLGL